MHTDVYVYMCIYKLDFFKVWSSIFLTFTAKQILFYVFGCFIINVHYKILFQQLLCSLTFMSG